MRRRNATSLEDSLMLYSMYALNLTEVDISRVSTVRFFFFFFFGSLFTIDPKKTYTKTFLKVYVHVIIIDQ